MKYKEFIAEALQNQQKLRDDIVNILWSDEATDLTEKQLLDLKNVLDNTDKSIKVLKTNLIR